MNKLSSKLNWQTLTGILALSISCSALAESLFADAHIHYNWDQAEIISVDEIVQKLKRENVGLAIVSSTPSHLALKLKQAGGNTIVPFFSPYTHELGKRDWFLNRDLAKTVEAALKSGDYQGIGEIHFMTGFPPTTDNPVFLDLLILAEKYNVPVLIHIDSGNENAFLNVCSKYFNLKIIFAHAGGNLKAKHISQILTKCKNVWIDFAARDPWRYGGLTGRNGALLPEWENLVMKYPNRIITGTDPVWRVTRTQSWDQSDEGWDHFEKLIQYHRQWINNLPQQIQEQIRWKNVFILLNRQ